MIEAMECRKGRRGHSVRHPNPPFQLIRRRNFTLDSSTTTDIDDLKHAFDEQSTNASTPWLVVDDLSMNSSELMAANKENLKEPARSLRVHLAPRTKTTCVNGKASVSLPFFPFGPETPKPVGNPTSNRPLRPVSQNQAGLRPALFQSHNQVTDKQSHLHTKKPAPNVLHVSTLLIRPYLSETSRTAVSLRPRKTFYPSSWDDESAQFLSRSSVSTVRPSGPGQKMSEDVVPPVFVHPQASSCWELLLSEDDTMFTTPDPFHELKPSCKKLAAYDAKEAGYLTPSPLFAETCAAVEARVKTDSVDSYVDRDHHEECCFLQCEKLALPHLE
jgi:hypothetical protein